MAFKQSVKWVVFALVAISYFATNLAIQCYKCGEYNDGVGSITPCINYTHMKLIDCPMREHTYCIKYQSEGTVVRDCVAECQEKETWGTRTFCCTEDGCNSSTNLRVSAFHLTLVLLFALFLAH